MEHFHIFDVEQKGKDTKFDVGFLVRKHNRREKNDERIDCCGTPEEVAFVDGRVGGLKRQKMEVYFGDDYDKTNPVLTKSCAKGNKVFLLRDKLRNLK